MGSKTTLYVVRHGLTMFNKIGRAQGWSDTPLTAEGETGIRELGAGLKARNLHFKAAFSSDSGRTMITMNLIMEQLGFPKIPYQRDSRLREWCFGSLDGGYNGDMNGVLPKTKALKNLPNEKMTYETFAKALLEVDTAGWAEPWVVIKKRIWDSFSEIANSAINNGGGNILVISHSITIRTLCDLIEGKNEIRKGMQNGSVTEIDYTKEHGFNLNKYGDMSYRKLGKTILAR